MFLTENAPISRQGMAGAIILSSVYTGLLLGAIVVSLVLMCFSHEALLAYAWRIPFLCSAIFGAIACYIRWSDVESPKFMEQKIEKQLYKLPLLHVLRHYTLALFQTIVLSAVLAVPIYLFAVYLPTHFTLHLHLSAGQALLISVVTLSVISIVVLIVGYFADRLGPYRVFAAGCIGFIGMAYPIFFFLAQETWSGVVIAESLLIILLSLIAGSIFPLLINRFPVGVCYSGVAIGFNTGMMIFGSTAPLIAVTLIEYTGDNIAPFWYLLLAAILSFTALPFFKDKRFVGSFARGVQS